MQLTQSTQQEVHAPEAHSDESTSAALTWLVNQCIERQVYAPIEACPVSAKKVVWEGADE